ncbi:MAG: hypothetical protein ACPGVD_02045 [Flavobacteriales bacterium]
MKYWVFIVLLVLSCNETFNEEEYSDDTEIGEYISVSHRAEIIDENGEEDTTKIVIVDLNFDYEDLSKKFLFSVNELDSLYKYFGENYYPNSGEINEVLFLFLNKEESVDFSEYYTYLQGEFIWKEMKFYVFYRYVDACGYYNGISLLPVDGEKKYIDINGGIGDGGVYSLNVSTFQKNDTLFFDEETWTDEEEDGIADIVEITGFWELSLTHIYRDLKSIKNYSVHYNEDFEPIDTLNMSIWFSEE